MTELWSRSARPLELYDRPANRFVAGFIGSPAMNFIDGTLTEGGLALPGGAVLPLRHQSPAPEGSKLTYGIRPEHLQLAPAGAPATIPAVVGVIEPTGLDTTLIVRTDGGSLTVVLRERVNLWPGDAVALRPIVEHSHLFDDRGNRISTL